MFANNGSLRKKVVCFNDIVSYGLTTNPPKESKGMACDVIFATDYHGLSRCVRVAPCDSVAQTIALMLVATGFTRLIRVTP